MTSHPSQPPSQEAIAAARASPFAPHMHEDLAIALDSFAAAAVAIEREACAQLAWHANTKRYDGDSQRAALIRGALNACEEIAAAIRQRGKEQLKC